MSSTSSVWRVQVTFRVARETILIWKNTSRPVGIEIDRKKLWNSYENSKQTWDTHRECSAWNWKWRRIRDTIRCHVDDELAAVLHHRPFHRLLHRCHDYSSTTAINCQPKAHFWATKAAKTISEFAFKRPTNHRRITMVGGLCNWLVFARSEHSHAAFTHSAQL